MSKKKETATLRDTLGKICYSSEREAAIALEVFSHWVRTKTDTIWARDFAALARLEWPMEFYNYGWSPESLLTDLFEGSIGVYRDSADVGWKISVPDPVLISVEE